MSSVLSKTFRALLAAAVLLPAAARAFDEGIDYKTLSSEQATESGDKVEVLELFWYGCPHCFHLEPVIKNWLTSKPEYVVFRRMPAVLGGSWANHARAFYAAEAMGVMERLHEPFFAALHEEKQRLYSPDDIADWFEKHGVHRDEFLKAFHSFIVDMKVRRAQQYGNRIALDGVPAFVVNGKYITSPSMTAGAKRAMEVVDFLAAKEAGVDTQVADVDAGEAAESTGPAGAGAVQAPAQAAVETERQAAPDPAAPSGPAQ